MFSGHALCRLKVCERKSRDQNGPVLFTCHVRVNKILDPSQINNLFYLFFVFFCSSERYINVKVKTQEHVSHSLILTKGINKIINIVNVLDE